MKRPVVAGAFDYTPAGLVTRKAQNGGGESLEATYSYNDEARVTTIHYPDGGPSFDYYYDSMGRPNQRA